MKRSIGTVLFLVVRHLLGAREVRDLAELSFAELLARKKVLLEGNSTESEPAALALAGGPPEKEFGLKGLHKRARGKTFYEEEDEDDKVHVHKKDEHKIHDVLNTSIMVLSYLAFGGYLLCMIASALREKRRRFVMAYPTAGAPPSHHFAHVLQHYMAHRPTRPYIRFPAVTLHQGRKKRRKRRWTQGGKSPGKGPAEVPIFAEAVDFVGILAPGGR